MALTFALQPIDGVAVSYADATVSLGSTISKANKYYTQESYKDDVPVKGKTFHYCPLTVMISARQINSLISQDKFDAEAAMKKVSELEALVTRVKETGKSGTDFLSINSAGQCQLEAKKYVRRIRDRVLHSNWDREQLQNASSSRMAEDLPPQVLCDYSETVDEILQLIVIAGRVRNGHGYVMKS